MGVLRLLFTVFLLTVASSSSQGATVSPVDEERAINATQLLIQRLEADTPIRIGNVSFNTVDENIKIIHSLSAISQTSSSAVPRLCNRL